jgi:hypothetical protein
MRLVDDEMLVLSLIEAEPLSDAAAAAVGRLLVYVGDVPLTPRCPLVVFVTGGRPERRWQDSYPPRPGSLFAQLIYLRSLVTPTSDVYRDLLEEFMALRELLNEDLT